MPYHVTCLGCETRLRVADDRPDDWLTCPRCLVKFPNPGMPGDQPAAETGITTQPPIQTGITKRPPPSLPSADEDARRDGLGTMCGAFVIVILAAPGIAFLIGLVEPARGKYSFPGLLTGISIGLGAGLVCFGLATALVMRARIEPRSTSVAGKVIIGIGAVILGGLAAIIVFFVTCWAGIIGGDFT